MPFCKSDRRAWMVKLIAPRHRSPFSANVGNLPCMARLRCHVLLVLLCSALGLVACSGKKPSLKTYPSGVYHLVTRGQTLTDVARSYHISPQIVARANNLSPSERLEEGRVLFIPGASQVRECGGNGKAASPPTIPSTPPEGAKGEAPPERKSPPADSKTPVTTSKRKTPAPRVVGEEKSAAGLTTSSVGRGGLPQPPKRKEESAPAGKEESPHRRTVSSSQGSATSTKGQFSWPVKGRVVSKYGVQPGGMIHNHIRIAAGEGAVVSSAAAGTVIFSALLKDFGETIIIRHENGFATVYTNLVDRRVKTGQLVKRGENIARVAPSDRRGESYIQFEIRRHNKPQNPLSFLP